MEYLEAVLMQDSLSMNAVKDSCGRKQELKRNTTISLTLENWRKLFLMEWTFILSVS